MASETIKQFILRYLIENRNRPKECYIYAIFAAFTKKPDKRKMSYASFRTEVNWLKKHRYIESTEREINTVDPKTGKHRYGKSYYKAIRSLDDYNTMERKPGEKIK